ncbi:MAG: alpha-galactosidase [Hyphomonadaceae bacterium]|nr:MAG: alpha-galactosidase [Hyphomonadaceae bacterium]KAF0183829.1 MAG: alpha-galactosidase [Hyphomonadaceae bacterium]
MRKALNLFSAIFVAKIIALVLVTAAFAGEPVRPLLNNNGLARTPPMGWNSWYAYKCDIDETRIRAIADAMVTSGMKAAGYEYVIIDDCWQVGRDANGTILADPVRFASGIKALADYVHSKGLKFGIYSDAGIATCEGRPGSHGYEYQDARTYASWGVDYLKYDWCNTSTQDRRESYLLMSDALQKSGRPIVFSICEWGSGRPWEWGRASGGNLWRTTGDIWDHWESGPVHWQQGLKAVIDSQADLSAYSGPGGWNDPDMLQAGNGGMNDTEYRTQFSMWAILAAPLIASNNLMTMNDATRTIFTNQEIIAVDQDTLGIQGRRLVKTGNSEIWAKPLSDGSRAFVLLNKAETAQTIVLNWQDVGYVSSARLNVRNLWSHQIEGKFAGTYSAVVPAHGAVMLKIYQ